MSSFTIRTREKSKMHILNATHKKMFECLRKKGDIMYWNEQIENTKIKLLINHIVMESKIYMYIYRYENHCVVGSL